MLYRELTEQVINMIWSCIKNKNILIAHLFIIAVYVSAKLY
jgi:hypothetical protein